MLRRIIIVALVLGSIGMLVGCDLTKLPNAIYDQESEQYNIEAMTFAGAVFNESYDGDDTETHTFDSDEISTEGIACDVDCGLAIWEVTEENRCYIYHKFGINATGVIIFESKNSDQLRFGDKIIKINDGEIESACDIVRIIGNYKAGDTVKVTVLRDGKTITVDLVLTQKVPGKVTFN